MNGPECSTTTMPPRVASADGADCNDATIADGNDGHGREVGGVRPVLTGMEATRECGIRMREGRVLGTECLCHHGAQLREW